MAVNGVEIKLGQTWKMRDGDKAKVTEHLPGKHLCWRLTSPAPNGYNWVVFVDDDGRALHDTRKCDLDRLLVDGQPAGDDHEALTFGPIFDTKTKLSNPKDAIGDSKVPLWLLSPIAKAQWAAAQFVGLVKYGAFNWRAVGVRSSTYLSAMQRHIDAYISGEEVDPVDGTPHLGHIMACAAILIDAKAAGKLTDDRPPVVSLRGTYAEAEAQMAATKALYLDSPAPHHYTIADTQEIAK